MLCTWDTLVEGTVHQLSWRKWIPAEIKTWGESDKIIFLNCRSWDLIVQFNSWSLNYSWSPKETPPKYFLIWKMVIPSSIGRWHFWPGNLAYEVCYGSFWLVTGFGWNEMFQCPRLPYLEVHKHQHSSLPLQSPWKSKWKESVFIIYLHFSLPPALHQSNLKSRRQILSGQMIFATITLNVQGIFTFHPIIPFPNTITCF